MSLQLWDIWVLFVNFSFIKNNKCIKILAELSFLKNVIINLEFIEQMLQH